MAELDSFIGLSMALTGLSSTEIPSAAQIRDVSGAAVSLAQVYLDRLRKAYPTEFADLLSKWMQIEGSPDPDSALGALLASEAGARLAAREIVKIWYLSTIDDPMKPIDATGKSAGQLGGDLGQFQLSAMWKLIGAPVPGYSNLPHGYWINPPDGVSP